MNPEQRLLIIHEYFSVECFVFLIGTLIRMFHPQRMDVAERYRTFVDLHTLSRWRNFYNFLLTIFILFFFCFCIFMNMLYNYIVFSQFGFVDCLIFLLCIFFGEENLYRHERTVFFQNLSHSIFICKFHTLFIQKQSDFCTDGSLIAILHIILCAAVTFPMYRNSPFFIRQRVNVHFVCYHKCRIESQTKMSNDLIFVGFIFILL